MSNDTVAPNSTPPQRRKHSLWRIALTVLVLLLIVVACVIWRVSESRTLKDWTDKQALPNVVLISPSVAPQGPVLNLPGRLEAFSRASIFARVSGYLKSWKFDIGAPVKAGQLLAEIDAPATRLLNCSK